MPPVVADCQLNAYNFEVLREQPPAHYQALRFDPNNTCNLHCVYCHNHRSDWTVDTDRLREFLAAKILSVEYFQVGCIMEPTMDQRLADIMQVIGESPARPSGVFVLQTNGLLLHRHNHAKMVAAGLTNLSVSLDAADPQMQRELRGGMSLAKVVRNVEAFRKAAPGVFVEFISVVTSTNIGRMESLVDLAINCGAKRVIFRELLYYPDSDVVDHGRMCDLLLNQGDFDTMAKRVRARFEGRIELIFAPNRELEASAIRMLKESQRAGHHTKMLTPLFHREVKFEQSRPPEDFAAFEAIAARLRAYEQTEISTSICDTDIMFRRGVPGAMEHYISVGRSAVRVIAQTMIAAERSSFSSVLDLPCGGGRVTRHLAALFPDAQLFASELERDLRDFTCRSFNAEPFEASTDFTAPASRLFELIFVGSLLTHFDSPVFIRALGWFIAALEPNGVLIATTHGRRHDYVERIIHRTIDIEKWDRASYDAATTGFGYVETEQKSGTSYGLSYSMPSWLAREIEKYPGVSIIGFQEAAWDNHQDMFALKKRMPGSLGPSRHDGALSTRLALASPAAESDKGH
jgi:MoaA/NifB/PqqE/SkfB family radical SAM enzyme/SAM-dependent methyltransferase